MGSDLGPHVIIEAACLASISNPNLNVLLVGDQSIIKPMVVEVFEQSEIPYNETSKRVQLIDAEKTIGMHEKPSSALRKRNHSSMGIALSLLADGKVDGCVSAGNTAALLVLSRATIKLLPGVERPAISTILPRINGFTRVLDLGANMDCDSETLFYFGVMGSVVSKVVDQVKNPTVGLLNVGVEDAKGKDQVKQAASRLQQEPTINYHGFVEGNEIYTGDVDVVVCDGFVGNSVLKASEGLISFFGHLVNNKLLSGFRGTLMQWLMRPALKRLRDEINPERYNGASFLGLEKVVVKSHGSANAAAVGFAIDEAIQQVQNLVPEKIRKALEQLENSEEDCD